MKVKIERDKEHCESKKYKEIGKIMKVAIERDKEDCESKNRKRYRRL